MTTIDESPYEEASSAFGDALIDYIVETSVADPVRDDPENLGACLWVILAPDPYFEDRAMTEEEDRIIRAYFVRVTATLNWHAGVAKRLHERRRERERRE